jgi:hypothetical protein
VSVSVPLLIAAALALALAVAHSYLGERWILIPLLRKDDLPRLLGSSELTKRTLRLAWHITSVCGLGFAALLVALASPGGAAGRTQAQVIAATFALCGVVALAGSRGRHPSWIAFFAAGIMTWLG